MTRRILRVVWRTANLWKEIKGAKGNRSRNTPVNDLGSKSDLLGISNSRKTWENPQIMRSVENPKDGEVICRLLEERKESSRRMMGFDIENDAPFVERWMHLVDHLQDPDARIIKRCARIACSSLQCEEDGKKIFKLEKVIKATLAIDCLRLYFITLEAKDESNNETKTYRAKAKKPQLEVNKVEISLLYRSCYLVVEPSIYDLVKSRIFWPFYFYDASIFSYLILLAIDDLLFKFLKFDCHEWDDLSSCGLVSFSSLLLDYLVI
ncbi:unnamed protein product [Dovyalis caffra]|uniref:Uncharacterized protein n=1 Tax=Dovyalis caffra TaxID=77055 RepID=A0AAV1SF69_9ROSI|nr:unnamed protein product [Dovyalis caffra]